MVPVLAIEECEGKGPMLVVFNIISVFSLIPCFSSGGSVPSIQWLSKLGSLGPWERNEMFLV